MTDIKDKKPEVILVYIGVSKATPRLFKVAKDLAVEKGVPWVAVTVDSPYTKRYSRTAKKKIAKNSRLAEQMGAEIVALTGDDTAKVILSYARVNNVRDIFVGKRVRPKIIDFLAGSLVYDLITDSGDINVHVLSENKAKSEAVNFSATKVAFKQKLLKMLYGVLSVLVAFLFIHLFMNWMSLVSVSMIFLLAVLCSAAWWGLWSSIAASVCGFIIILTIHIQPIYTFRVSRLNDVLTFMVFLIISFVIGELTAKVRDHADRVSKREDITNKVYAFTRHMSEIDNMPELIDYICQYFHHIFHHRTFIFLEEDGDLILKGNYPALKASPLKMLDAVTWSFKNATISGVGTEVFSNLKGFLVPLAVMGKVIGVLGIYVNDKDDFFNSDNQKIWRAMIEQAAIVIARLELKRAEEHNLLLQERERLQTALLSSVSHDLRTPLASIIGASSSLLAYQKEFDLETRNDLLATVLEEAERLNRYVGNLLNMTKLEAGIFKLNYKLCDVRDVIDAALNNLGSALAKRDVQLTIPDEVPLLNIDPVMTEMVFVNLLDNALKYSQDGTKILIAVAVGKQAVTVAITDEGCGISKADQKRIFDMFYRVEKGDMTNSKGSGLGLAICFAVLAAEKAKVDVKSDPKKGGSSFIISFPLPG